MNWKTESKPLLWIIVIFSACFYLPVEVPRVQGAIMESLYPVKWYAREHVLLCLVPAFFHCRYRGRLRQSGRCHEIPEPKYAKDDRLRSCFRFRDDSCRLFLHHIAVVCRNLSHGRRAWTRLCVSLFRTPSINILAIVLTARILGPEMGIARALGAIVFAVVIRLLMHFFPQRRS